MFLFEFMDLKWVPDTLRATIHDALDSCLGAAPRRYYDWVSREILELVEQNPAGTIVELGAGTAPITRALAGALNGRKDISLRVSDLYPNKALYKSLEKMYPGVVRAELSPVNFSQPMNFPEGSLLVLSAAFHHLRPSERGEVLKILSGYRVAVFEPLRRNPASLFLCLFGFVPAIMTPLLFWNRRPGNWRRIFWCWLCPLATLIIVWDGLVSCLRCWTEKEWKDHLARVVEDGHPVFVKSEGFNQMVVW
jgi:hypothetical protein